MATLTYMAAIQRSPLSLTAPFLAFTPVFMLVTAPILVQEYPSVSALFGISAIVLGTWFLNCSDSKSGSFFAPFIALTRERGSQLMIVTAFLFSITGVLGKVGVNGSSPLFFGAVYYSFTALGLLVPVIIRREHRFLTRPALLVVGVLTAISIASQMIGIQMVQVSYFIALKRVSLLLSILLGVIFLKERNLKDRFTGGFLMFIGVVVIAIWGK